MLQGRACVLCVCISGRECFDPDFPRGKQAVMFVLVCVDAGKKKKKKRSSIESVTGLKCQSLTPPLGQMKLVTADL